MLEHKREFREIADQASAIPALRVIVVYTFVEEALRVCSQTAQFVEQLGMTLRILVPVVVPYPLPIERPPVDPQFIAHGIIEACAGVDVPVRIDVRLCRDRLQCVGHELERPSIVVLPRRRRWAWGERRLERTLRRDGYEVVVL
jgi:hypothetical protein